MDSSTSTLKSPLRYPGGKSRGSRYILIYFPCDITRACSPFFGGGSVELALAQRGVGVAGYDKFRLLTTFWKVLLKEPGRLAGEIQKHYPLPPGKFHELQRRLSEQEIERGRKLEQAALFFVLNRASFSGATLAGGLSPGHPRFTPASINRLATFRAPDGLSVSWGDFRTVLPKHKQDFLYLDPPYANGGRLYGRKGDLHKTLDHEGLASMLTRRDGWLLSYNDCPEVRNWYRGYRALKPEWAYGMNNTRKSNELLIFSRDLPEDPNHQRL